MEELYIQQEFPFGYSLGLGTKVDMHYADKLFGAGEHLYRILGTSEKRLETIIERLEKSGEGSVIVGAGIGDLTVLNNVLGNKQSKWGIREVVIPNDQGRYSKFQVYFFDSEKPKSESQTFPPRMHLK